MSYFLFKDLPNQSSLFFFENATHASTFLFNSSLMNLYNHLSLLNKLRKTPEIQSMIKDSAKVQKTLKIDRLSNSFFILHAH